MTLKELKQAVGSPKENVDFRELRKSDDIFLSVQTESDALITVMKSGHIIYQTGKRITSFSITACGEYTYTFSDGSSSVISEEEFDKSNWMIRVILEGESRIAKNLLDEYYVHCLGVKFGDSAETIRALDMLKEDIFVDPDSNAEECVLKEMDLQQLKKALNALVPRQKEFVTYYYAQNMSYKEIAREWGCSVKAVRKVKYRVIETLRLEWSILSH